MTYSVRYQVFVSSTFNDLMAERSEVIQALWELDCIPTGMEAFVASNESQWDVIRKVIDECDYYVLILGGRYGSITNDGISYTEKEYRYAKSIGLPILAFLHAKPENIPLGNSERDQASIGKLQAIRQEIMDNYPIRTWSTASELGGLVSRSLIREIKVNPRQGWIRNDGSSPINLLERVNELSIENAELRNEQAKHDGIEILEDLENGDDEIEIAGERRRWMDSKGYVNEEWAVLVTYDNVFRDIGPILINEATEEELQERLATFHELVDHDTDARIIQPKLYFSTWNEIVIQFRALGLVEPGDKKRGVNDKSSYWKLTKKGDGHLVSLMAKRKKNKISA